MDKYRGLQALSVFLMIFGTAFLAGGVILLMLGLMDLSNVQSQMYGFNAVFGIWKIGSGLGSMLSGLLLLAAGQAIRVFIDIAVQTAPIAEIAINSAKTVAFFERMSGQNPDSDAPVEEGEYRGYRWRAYRDGRVEGEMNGETKQFKSANDFTKYANLTRPAQPRQ